MEIIAIVPFRAGSKGLKNKNFLTLGDIPLWERALNQALVFSDQVILSSDRLDKCELRGDRKVLLDDRPQELATDDTEMKQVIEHIIKKYDLRDEIIVLLQPTSPLRAQTDIDKAIKLFQTGKFSLVLTVTEVDKNHLKAGLLENEKLIPINNPEYLFQNRQSLPSVFKPNGAIYVFQADTFRANGGFPKEAIGVLKMDETSSTDIDGLNDLKFAESQIEKRHFDKF